MKYLFFFLFILLKILIIILFTEFIHEVNTKEFFVPYFTIDYNEKTQKCKIQYYDIFTKKNMYLDIN